MLVFTRNEKQRIFIGDDVVVTVLTTETGRAKIGIEAPWEIPVDREEVRRRQQADAARNKHRGGLTT